MNADLERACPIDNTAHRRKFGLLCYRYKDNLGDEIQSLATERLLPEIDCYVDRDDLIAFKGESGQVVDVLLHGWFCHAPECWPPSEFIRPLIISFHLTENLGRWSRLAPSRVLLTDPVVEYLRSFAPVDARDVNTLRHLLAAGVDAYFSGCLTLTLDRPGAEADANLVVLNDLPDEVAFAIRQKSKKKKIIRTRHSGSPEKTPAERLAAASNLLDIYASASCVIATRLHCALPCLAFGTPVLLLDVHLTNIALPVSMTLSPTAPSTAFGGLRYMQAPMVRARTRPTL